MTIEDWDWQNVYRQSIPNGFGVVPNGPYPNQFALPTALAVFDLKDGGDTLEFQLLSGEWFNIICPDDIYTSDFDVSLAAPVWTERQDLLTAMQASAEVAAFLTVAQDSIWRTESDRVDFTIEIIGPLC